MTKVDPAVTLLVKKQTNKNPSTASLLGCFSQSKQKDLNQRGRERELHREGGKDLNHKSAHYAILKQTNV